MNNKDIANIIIIIIITIIKVRVTMGIVTTLKTNWLCLCIVDKIWWWCTQVCIINMEIWLHNICKNTIKLTVKLMEYLSERLLKVKMKMCNKPNNNKMQI